MQLTERQRQIMLGMARGLRLKDHRDIEGSKNYALHYPDGRSEPVDAADVEALVELGLISSNKKFPSATYWPTEVGHAAILTLQSEASPEHR
ncbi:MAG: hypothetical protein NZM18_03245 [Thermoflexales bacterium]|nr:hypothetical protein [Thermoflexales bacterium]MDW8350397.1 hypothetical protein [Anaerolineae bacterium]